MIAPSPAALPIIALVVPCYNEEAQFTHTLAALSARLDDLVRAGRVSDKSYMFFVDDGSRDRTWVLIAEAAASRPDRVRGLKLARNVGHQNALIAGLDAQVGRADATISLDADLQDDIFLIDEMVQKFTDGAEIVFAVREGRDSDTAFKRSTAVGYYRMLRWLGVDIIHNHADYRLMSDRALRALSEFGEVNIFLRGLVVQLGFKTAVVKFDRLPRQHGETKYPLSKMLALAVNGITSFSIRPLRIVTTLGLIMFAFFVGAVIWVLAAWLAGATIEGWTSLMLVFLLISSFQTLALGVIGEYVGKTYFETKARPRYIVEKELVP
jgi:glycosyltransferase involved in cell wall biosynthesis